VDGTANVIDAAIDAEVGRVLMLSSDKACDPTNLYGATKLVAEKLMVDANVYNRNGFPKFACTRYGNVIGSRGSVLPRFQAQHAAGEPLSVTDPDMTRFVLTLEQGVRFVLESLAAMAGGEVFVPRLPAVTVRTIAEAAAWPDSPRLVMSGLRPGEKRHETLVSAHESSRVIGWPEHFTIWPERVSAEGFSFSSDAAERLDVARFRELAGLVLESSPIRKREPATRETSRLVTPGNEVPNAEPA
jgi:UDP-N-acetylglucosamine 4,6-dehydratase